MSDYEYWSNQHRKVNSFNHEIGLVSRVLPEKGEELESMQTNLFNMIEEGLKLSTPCLDDDQYYCPTSDDLSDKFAPLFTEFSEKVEQTRSYIYTTYNKAFSEHASLIKKSMRHSLSENEKKKVRELEDIIITYSF